ncbi:uncharacterized protein LY89DRAFT_727016 [Mollisia scopiformis]|uniref:Uncharacterized protein n=1 Tax=Mollisia scopiformis TaxID=149040 RepID=A0A194XVC3_MOLSC|nr:uncharacterized protein LY89DRAFT_727016 [Mollisia scopiformis]KUJ23964.1 hypothetical protein LY89DRAFT_727016 [Mollisia scopiformis]
MSFTPHLSSLQVLLVPVLLSLFISSSSAVETVTAIVDTPYTDYLDFQQFVLIASGPTPTDDDFASISSTAFPLATASCSSYDVGATVELVEALADIFCTGLDLSEGSSVFQTADICALGCNSSYTQIITSCEFNSQLIYGSGSLQDTCGTFAISLSSAVLAPTSSTTFAPPPPSPTPTLSPPGLQDQECYEADSFGKHSDIAGKVQSSYATTFCSTNDQTFTSGTAPVLWNAGSIIFRDGLTPYHYTVSWLDGCMTTATQQSMDQPLAGDSTVTCVSLVKENWRNCNNGGAGGTRIAGCLKYNFAATLNTTQI